MLAKHLHAESRRERLHHLRAAEISSNRQQAVESFVSCQVIFACYYAKLMQFSYKAYFAEPCIR